MVNVSTVRRSNWPQPVVFNFGMRTVLPFAGRSRERLFCVSYIGHLKLEERVNPRERETLTDRRTNYLEIFCQGTYWNDISVVNKQLRFA